LANGKIDAWKKQSACATYRKRTRGLQYVRLLSLNLWSATGDGESLSQRIYFDVYQTTPGLPSFDIGSDFVVLAGGVSCCDIFLAVAPFCSPGALVLEF
jgi:hypothetical protein